MSIEETVQALVFVALDGLSFAVPVAKVPVALLEKIILGLEEADLIHFEPTEAQLDQIRSQAAGVAAAKASAVTSSHEQERQKNKK